MSVKAAMTASKARAPLFRRHVRRPRLTALLDATSAQAIVLNAPPGYGKTTLASEWLQGRDRVAWYRASLGSADVAALSVGLARAIRPFIANAGARLEQRVRVGDTPEKAVRALAELLAEDLTSWPSDAWIVIDDYHLVMESAPVEDFIDWLLTLSSVRLLVTTRRRPGWASARRELYGELLEITRDELAMRSEEAEKVLEELSTATARSLVESADGWPALIGLAALTDASDLPDNRVSDALFRYFAEEVLRQEPSGVQEFMLTAAVLPSIHPRRDAEVLGGFDHTTLMARLESEGLLRKASGRSYFHPLLREFLLDRIESENPQRVRELAERALVSAVEDAEWVEAFELAERASRLEIATDILHQAAPSLFREGRDETVVKWLAICQEACPSPETALVKAELLDRQGHHSEARELALEVANSLPPRHPRESQAWSLAARAARTLCDFEAGLEFDQKASGLARDSNERAQALWGAFLSAVELEHDDMETYFKRLERALPATIDGRLRLAAAQMQIAEYKGSLSGVRDEVTPTLRQADAQMDPLAYSNALANFVSLQIAVGDFAGAAESAETALSFCQRLHLDFATSYCLVRRGRAELGLKDSRAVRATMASLRPRIEKSEDPYLRLEYELLALRVSLSARDTAFSSKRLNVIESKNLPRASHGEYVALRALAEAAYGDLDHARTLAEAHHAITRSRGVGYHLAELAHLIATIRTDQHSTELPSAAEAVIANLVRGEFMEALIIAYRTYPHLLTLLRDADELRRIVGEMMCRAGDVDLAKRLSFPLVLLEGATKTFGLTPREEEVVDLLARGLSNAEIAQTLFISHSTAKVHVHRVFRKLGVRTRAQAIVKWNELAGG